MVCFCFRCLCHTMPVKGGCLPRVGAKAPVLVPCRTALGLGEFRMKLLVEGVRIWSFCAKQLYPRWFFKIVAHQKCVMFCLYDSVDLPRRGVKHLNCSQPRKARMPISWSSVGMTTSRSAMQLRNTSLPICVSRGGSEEGYFFLRG